MCRQLSVPKISYKCLRMKTTEHKGVGKVLFKNFLELISFILMIPFFTDNQNIQANHLQK